MPENNKPNTEISYLYRDATNYKVHNEAVVKGNISEKDVKFIKDNCLNDGEHFYPASVGLPEKDFVSEGYAPYPDDPDWFELQDMTPTDKAPTVTVTAEDLVAAFKAGKGKEKIAE